MSCSTVVLEITMLFFAEILAGVLAVAVAAGISWLVLETFMFALSRSFSDAERVEARIPSLSRLSAVRAKLAGSRATAHFDRTF